MARASYNRPFAGRTQAVSKTETYYRGTLPSGKVRTSDIKTASAWKHAGFTVQIVTVTPF